MSSRINPAAGVQTLLESGEIRDLGDGRLLLAGRALGILRWLDARLEALATSDGAFPIRVPAVIDRTTLARAGHLDAFPGMAAEVVSSEPPHGRLLTPALCYHAYAMLAGDRCHTPVALTCAGPCVRCEAASALSLSRLWEFTMREVIFVGMPDWVENSRRRWMAIVPDFTSSMGLSGEMALATDPFFSDAGRGRKLMQQLKALKYELQMDVGASGPAAVASFNLHEAFFGERFDMTTPDGSPAHSSCVAFGLERWMLAIVAQLGVERAARLAGAT